MNSGVYRSMFAWCSAGIGTPKSVGSTPLSIGAVCVCVPVTREPLTADAARLQVAGDVSYTTASETPVVSTARNTAGHPRRCRWPGHGRGSGR